MMENCNLVMAEHNRIFWSTNNAGKGKGCCCCCKLESDGTLVVYTAEKRVAWASGA